MSHAPYALVALSSGLNVGGAGRSSESFALLAALALLICSSLSSPNLIRFFTAMDTFGSLTFLSCWEESVGEGKRGREGRRRRQGRRGERGEEGEGGEEGGGRAGEGREGKRGREGRRGREEGEGGEGEGCSLVAAAVQRWCCPPTPCSAVSTALEYMPMATSRCPFSSSTHACSSWYSNCRNTP